MHLVRDIELARSRVEQPPSQIENVDESESEAAEDVEVDSAALTHLQRRRQNEAIFQAFLDEKGALQSQESAPHVFDTDSGSKNHVRDIDRIRAYQAELFEKAKEENIIVVLDTGSGKTLIATLVGFL